MTHFKAGMKGPDDPNCPIVNNEDKPTLYELIGVNIWAGTKEIERAVNEKLKYNVKRQV